MAVLAEVAIIFGVLPAGQPGIPEEVLYPAYVLALGSVTLAARFALVRDAQTVDVAAEDLIVAEEERRVVEGVEGAVRRQERLLHATVLNTLTAIVRGGVSTPELRERLTARCSEAVEVMLQVRLLVEPVVSTRSPDQWLERDLGESLVDLTRAGVTVNTDCEPLRDLPVSVYDAIVTAAREALSNVLRHADARTVWLDAHVTGDRQSRRALVTIRDDGRGFSPTEPSERFGVRSAVVQSLADVGGTSVVTSEPGRGTRVEIGWSFAPAETSIAPYRPAARAFAYPILVSFGLFTVLELVLTRHELVSPGKALLAFGLYLALGVLVAYWSRTGAIPWWVVLVVAGLSPLVYQWQSQAVAPDHGPWTDWASAAIVALFVVVAGAGPAWSWLALVATWLLIQGDVIHELFAAGTALIIAAALFGRSTRRSAAKVEQARRQLVEERAAAAVSSASVRRLTGRYGSLRESGVTSLLDGIAEGRIDPDAADARFQAALEERFIRTVVKIDPAVDAVHALATSLAVRALHRGVFLDVDIHDTAPATAVRAALGRDSLLRAIECSQRGGSARFSARREGTVYAIRLITPISERFRDDMLGISLPGAVVDPSEPDMLWELRFHDGGQS